MGAKTIRGVDEELWRQVRMEALRRGLTLQEFAIRALEQAVQNSKQRSDWQEDERR